MAIVFRRSAVLCGVLEAWKNVLEPERLPKKVEVPEGIKTLQAKVPKARYTRNDNSAGEIPWRRSPERDSRFGGAGRNRTSDLPTWLRRSGALPTLRHSPV